MKIVPKTLPECRGDNHAYVQSLEDIKKYIGEILAKTNDVDSLTENFDELMHQVNLLNYYRKAKLHNFYDRPRRTARSGGCGYDTYRDDFPRKTDYHDHTGINWDKRPPW